MIWGVSLLQSLWLVRVAWSLIDLLFDALRLDCNLVPAVGADLADVALLVTSLSTLIAMRDQRIQLHKPCERLNLRFQAFDRWQQRLLNQVRPLP